MSDKVEGKSKVSYLGGGDLHFLFRNYFVEDLGEERFAPFYIPFYIE